jgi:3-dehydroquinate synthase class II
LERVAKLTEEEAKDELLKDVEKKYEEDILVKSKNWKIITKKNWIASQRYFGYFYSTSRLQHRF